MYSRELRLCWNLLSVVRATEGCNEPCLKESEQAFERQIPSTANKAVLVRIRFETILERSLITSRYMGVYCLIYGIIVVLEATFSWLCKEWTDYHAARWSILLILICSSLAAT
jgi:hypothetical protein